MVQKFDEMKSELVVTEKQLLKNLGFMVNVQHPHKLIISLLAVLGAVDTPLLQQAWNYMNDRCGAACLTRQACIGLNAPSPLGSPGAETAWYSQFSHQRVCAVPDERDRCSDNPAGRAHRLLRPSAQPAVVDAARGDSAGYVGRFELAQDAPSLLAH